MPDLSICIVTWNVEELLRNCLASIFKNVKNISFEVIVADNASKDNTINMIQSQFPSVKIIRNSTNAGFTIATNKDIKMAGGRYIMILNSDTEVIDGALEKMMQFMEKHPEYGAVAPKLVNADGSLQRSVKTFPSLEKVFYNTFFLDSLFPKSRIFGKYFMTWWDHNDERDIDQPMGSAIMVRRKVLDEVGLFDEKYYFWFDEVDLCFRIKKACLPAGRAGWKIRYKPDAQILHHLSQGFRQWKSPAQIIRGAVVWRKSRNYFFRKHYGFWTVPILWMFDIAQIILVLGSLVLIGLFIYRFIRALI